MGTVKQVKVSAVVTQATKDAVQIVADRERRSEGDIVRLALEQYLAGKLETVAA